MPMPTLMPIIIQKSDETIQIQRETIQIQRPRSNQKPTGPTPIKRIAIIFPGQLNQSMDQASSNLLQGSEYNDVFQVYYPRESVSGIVENCLQQITNKIGNRQQRENLHIHIAGVSLGGLIGAKVASRLIQSYDDKDSMTLSYHGYHTGLSLCHIASSFIRTHIPVKCVEIFCGGDINLLDEIATLSEKDVDCSVTNSNIDYIIRPDARPTNSNSANSAAFYFLWLPIQLVYRLTLGLVINTILVVACTICMLIFQMMDVDASLWGKLKQVLATPLLGMAAILLLIPATFYDWVSSIRPRKAPDFKVITNDKPHSEIECFSSKSVPAGELRRRKPAVTGVDLLVGDRNHNKCDRSNIKHVSDLSNTQ